MAFVLRPVCLPARLSVSPLFIYSVAVLDLHGGQQSNSRSEDGDRTAAHEAFHVRSLRNPSRTFTHDHHHQHCFLFSEAMLFISQIFSRSVSAVCAR